MTTIIGIDPGAKTGAFAVIGPNGLQTVGDIPSTDDGVNAAEFFRTVREFAPDVAIVERVNAMPRQGVSSVFTFGKAYGTILSALACVGVRTVLVPPAKWKAHYRLPGKDKEASRTLAIRLFPGVQGLNLKKHHGRAEALLLAHYHAETR